MLSILCSSFEQKCPLKVKPQEQLLSTKKIAYDVYWLLKKYVDYGNELKAQGRISMFAIAKMVTSPDIKYGKFGFTKLDENWIQ